MSVAYCVNSSIELRPPSSKPLPAGCFPRIFVILLQRIRLAGLSLVKSHPARYRSCGRDTVKRLSACGNRSAGATPSD